jgi:hypothetical protein
MINFYSNIPFINSKKRISILSTFRKGGAKNIFSKKIQNFYKFIYLLHLLSFKTPNLLRDKLFNIVDAVYYFYL